MGTLKTTGDRILRRVRDTGKNIFAEADIVDAANLAIDLIHSELTALESVLVANYDTITCVQGTAEYSLDNAGTIVGISPDSIQIENEPYPLARVEEPDLVSHGYVNLEWDPVTSGYKWTASGSGTNEYYLTTSAGANPDMGQPVVVTLDGTALTLGTVGSLSDHEYGFGDNDSLGFNTLYFADATGDPDSLSDDFIAYAPETGTPLVYYVTEGGSIGFRPCPDEAMIAKVWYFKPASEYHVSTYDDDALPFEGIWNRAIEELIMAELLNLEELPGQFRSVMAGSAWKAALSVTYSRGVRRRKAVPRMYQQPVRGV